MLPYRCKCNPHLVNDKYNIKLEIIFFFSNVNLYQIFSPINDWVVWIKHMVMFFFGFFFRYIGYLYSTCFVSLYEIFSTCLLVYLFTTESAVAQWKAFGSVSTTNKRYFKAKIVYVNNFKLFELDVFNIYA